MLDAKRRNEYAGLINSSGHHLLAVVNGILDMSKIETGNFEITPEPFAPAHVVAGCCELLALRAREAGVRLEKFAADDLPEMIADKRALNQILLNLLSNAIRFTDRGGTVTISARAEAAKMTFAVEDNGVGISDEDLPRVGEPYFQAGSSYDRRHGGTGLGLSIVKGLVRFAWRRNLDPQPGRRGHPRHRAAAARLRADPSRRRKSCASSRRASMSYLPDEAAHPQPASAPGSARDPRHPGSKTAGEEKCLSAATPILRFTRAPRAPAARWHRACGPSDASPGGLRLRSCRGRGEHDHRHERGIFAVGFASGAVLRQPEAVAGGQRAAKPAEPLYPAGRVPPRRRRRHSPSPCGATTRSPI